MRARLLGTVDGFRSFVLVFRTDDDAVAGLHQFARDQGLDAASLLGIGAVRRAVLGWFDVDQRDYRRIEIDEQVELVSLTGDVTGPDATQPAADPGPIVHAHAVLGRHDGSTAGGHLLEAIVRPTLEVLVTEAPTHLHRRRDPATGLPLIDLRPTLGG